MLPKNYKILISDSVEINLQNQIDYIIAESSSWEIAQKWYNGIVKAIKSLSKFPHRFAVAPENYYADQRNDELIRHLIYKKSFRIIFSVVGNEVRVLAIKHGAQL